MTASPVIDAQRSDDTAEKVQRRGLGPRVLGGLLLVALLLVAVALSLALGARDVALPDVWAALWSPEAGNNDHLAVRDLRLPRTVIGILAGAALGVAGAMMQGLTRNPIADPGLLGVNAGASLAVILAITWLGVSGASNFVWFAFLGAAVAAVLVYAVASVGWEGVTPVKLALVGAALTAVLTAVITLVLVTDRTALSAYRFWSVGSLTSRGWDVVLVVLPFVVVGLLLAVPTGRFLNAMALGDDLARGLGQNLVVGRLLVLLAVVLCCGGATALAGPIAFVGLMVPHAARFFVGPDHRWLLPYSALMGPVVLLVADVLGRLVVRPTELEAGLVVAVIGAPVLILLVRRSRAVTA